jgi:alginate O-acetyltransferase complex protein AlgJ
VTANRLDSSTAPGSGPGLPPLPESWLPREHPLHRPRHGIRQRSARVAALVFFCVPMLLLVVGVRAPEFENRRLADFPSVTDGFGLFTGLDRWATDHLPLRDKAVLAEDGISRGLFGEPPQFKTDQQKKDVGPVVAPTTTEPGVPAPAAPSEFQQVIEGSDGWLYLGFDVQGACQPKLPLNDVFQRISELRRAVESSGRKFVFLVAPNKSTMIPEHLPPGYFGQDCATKARDEFWSRVVAETGAVDLRPGLELAAERIKGQVYSKLDTHWTFDGGLVYARAIAEQVKPGVSVTWRNTQGKVVQVPGDLSSLLGQRKSVVLQSYRLAPDGVDVRSREVDGSFAEPRRVTQSSGKGVVDAKVGVLGDSFTFYVRQYVVAGFSDITLQNSDFVPPDPQRTGAMLADQDVVVFEAAERSLVGGVNPLLDPAIIAAISAELAKKPR